LIVELVGLCSMTNISCLATTAPLFRYFLANERKEAVTLGTATAILGKDCDQVFAIWMLGRQSLRHQLPYQTARIKDTPLSSINLR